MVNQGCMSLPTYYFEYGRHLARLHRPRRAYVPMSNTASHDNHEKINSRVSFFSSMGMGLRLEEPFRPHELRYYLKYINRAIFANGPCSIYQYPNMAPKLSGQTSIFGVVSFVCKPLMEIEGQKKLENFAILTRKPWSHA